MTGASIQFSMADKQIAAVMGSLRRLGGQDRAMLLRAIGVGLVEATMEHFATATDPTGQPWKALLPAYAAMKSGPGILRERGMSGGLQGSITFNVANANTVEWGSNKVYAAIHQFGGVIQPKAAKALVFRLGGRLVHARRVTIPARPYLGFGSLEQEAVQDATAVIFARAISGHR